MKEDNTIIKEFREKFVFNMNEALFGNEEELRKQGWEVGENSWRIKNDVSVKEVENWVIQKLQEQRERLKAEFLRQDVIFIDKEIDKEITKALKEQKEDIIKIAEGMKKDTNNHTYSHYEEYEDVGYNKALSDIVKNIKRGA